MIWKIKMREAFQTKRSARIIAVLTGAVIAVAAAGYLFFHFGCRYLNCLVTSKVSIAHPCQKICYWISHFFVFCLEPASSPMPDIQWLLLIMFVKYSTS